jgi:hypothetical protein
MPKLVDSENVTFPSREDWDRYFRAGLYIDHAGADKDYAPNQVCIDVRMPETMKCITLDDSHFLYTSCGFLSAPLDEAIDEFMSDYGYHYDSLDEARFLRNTLKNLIGKLDAFIASEEGK